MDFIIVQQIFTLLSLAVQGISIFPCPTDTEVAHVTCLDQWKVSGRNGSVSDPSRSFERHFKFD